MNITQGRPAALQAYIDDLAAYHLRFAAWLGLDPEAVAHLDETRPDNARHRRGS